MDAFMLLPFSLQVRQKTEIIKKCNDYTIPYGLQLSEKEIHQLIEKHREVLQKNGRIEFGGGVIQKLIIEFMDSPYINQDNYADTLMELQECFYYFKNESLETLSDNELMHLMKVYFDEVCHGSIDYLQSTMLENHCRDIRYGTNEYGKMNGYEDNYEDFLDWDEKE